MDGEATGAHARRVSRDIEKNSTFSHQKGGPLSSGFKWWFYTLSASEVCKGWGLDPHQLMWGKTLPQVLELQEWEEMVSASTAAAHRDSEVASKNSKP